MLSGTLIVRAPPFPLLLGLDALLVAPASVAPPRTSNNIFGVPPVPVIALRLLSPATGSTERGSDAVLSLFR